MVGIGTGKAYVNGKYETFTLYKTASAEKHRSSDDESLRFALIRAINAPDQNKEDQGGGVYRMRINEGNGYIVYKVNLNGVPNTAAIFHYHWHYNLDMPLTAN